MVEAIVGVALRAILASVLLGGVLAVLVLLATRMLALTAATRHALWTMALIATAVMPLAGIGVSVWKATAPPTAAAQRADRRDAPNAGACAARDDAARRRIPAQRARRCRAIAQASTARGARFGREVHTDEAARLGANSSAAPSLVDRCVRR